MLLDAHFDAASKNIGNLSAVVAKIAYDGSGDSLSAITAGLNTIGYRHAPVVAARNIFANAIENATTGWIEYLVMGSKIIPGFGHSHYKDRIDPIFQPCYDVLSDGSKTIIEAFRKALGELRGKDLYPNAAMITAALATELGLPPFMELWFFIAGRTPAWITSFTLPPQETQNQNANA